MPKGDGIVLWASTRRARHANALMLGAALSLSACQGTRAPLALLLPDASVRDAGDAPAADSGKPLQLDAGGGIIPYDGSQSQPDRLRLSPDNGRLTIGLDPLETLQLTATVNDSGAAASGVRWSAEPKDLGSIDPTTGVFTPSGVAGVVTITATAKSLYAKTMIDIRVAAAQEGDPEAGKTPAGAGGIGGVGGEGGGEKLMDSALRAALDKQPQTDAALSWLYPYDGTVWPRGLPPPLLQWRSTAHPALAVRVHIEVDSSFTYDGYFAPPRALAMGQPFVRVPVPQVAWKRALASGKSMRVNLSIAASDGAGGYAVYAPAKQLTFRIAPTTLKGTVYYNSYGTKLAENHGGAMGGNGRFGGATLAIRGDAYDPVLVAGKTSTDASGCRVCHTVSADGSRMLAQQADNMLSSSYDLKDANKESTFAPGDRGKFGWAALSADGSLAFGNAGPPGSNGANIASLPVSALYKLSDGQVLPVQGLPELVTQAATPAFSPDTSKLAFNLWAGLGTPSIAADGRSLVVVDFERTATDAYAFKNPRAVFKAQGEDRPGWPFFLPDGKGLVFQLEKSPGAGGERFATRKGARGELWWTDLEGHAHALDAANGAGYLPSSAGHESDATLQYEPTVAPLVAGGYAWIVFTSRRAYGNVATRAPFESDAREFDLTAGNAAGPTTKKLWVAAFDIPAKPGSDPSHPAFYLPAQELYAGNSRGFWVLDACKSEGNGCDSGDECCGGYCREVGVEFKQKVCSDQPPSSCSMEYDSCNVDADCCLNGNVSMSCIAGRCARLTLY